MGGEGKFHEEFLDYLYEKNRGYYRHIRLYGFDFARKVREGKDQGLCKELFGIYKNPAISRIREWGERRLKKAGEEGKGRGYVRELENMVRFLSRLSSSTAVKLYLAELCLRRAKEFKPRGFGRSEKKMQLLKKALNYLEGVLKEETDENRRKKALALKAEVYLELEHEGRTPGEMGTFMEQAFLKASENLSLGALFWLAERGHTGALQKAKERKELKENILWQARVAVLEKDWNKTLEFLKQALYEELPWSFSDPFWEDALKIIKSLPEEMQYEPLKDLWEALRSLEYLRRFHNLHLLWYWSRWRNVYEEMLEKALSHRDYKLALEVVDGLKARPMVRWAYLEKDKNFEKLVEAEYLARQDHYVRKELLSVVKTKKSLPKIEIKPTGVKEGTLAVHLYFKDDTGMAFIADHKGKVAYHKFSIKNVYQVYREFVASYRYGSFQVEKLGELLKILGETFDFLWKLSAEALLFIPYGFLHLLPLHGAWQEGKGLLLERFKIAYLPAWHLTEIPLNKPQTPGVVFENFKDHDFSRFLSEAEKQNLRICQKISGKDVLKEVEGNAYPRTLVLISHGKADPVNPFESCLEFDPPISFKELLKSSLHPQRVFLIACETDLDYAGRKPVDEYLSLATVFLAKGALEVVGTLWKVHLKRAEEFYIHLLDVEGDSLVEKYTSYLREKLTKNKDTTASDFCLKNLRTLQEYLPFRIYSRAMCEFV